MDRTLSAATTPSQSGPGSDGNEGVLCIPQISSITGTSPSDCLVSTRTLVRSSEQVKQSNKKEKKRKKER